MEHGGRRLTGWARTVVLGAAILWSLFQLWVASPLPYVLGVGLFNDTEIRSLHLAFALFLVYLSFPWRRGVITDRIPLIDWLMAVMAALAAAYLYLFYSALADRAGNPTGLDIGVAVAGILLLLEATRRALGWPLTIIAALFLFYSFAGPWLPEMIAHKGMSLARVASHQWLSTEGVFGVPVGVSAGFVFLFVLFGAMLEQAGGGQYFIRIAFALVGHMRGGPAKAGVLASGLTGMVSGSSIANVVTTGTFTIPLMKRVGFPGYKAGAIEVAASTNGQIMPPVMGAAAFLMVEYLNISYVEVMKHAVLPALLSYIALMYVVHLEAVKAGMKGLPRPPLPPLPRRLLGWGLTLSGMALFLYGVYWLLQGIVWLFGAAAPYVTAALLFIFYAAIVIWEAQRPLGEAIDPEHLPTLGEAARGGLHFLLPLLVLVWCLMVLRLSPATAVFYAILLMMTILVTQLPLRAFFNRQPVREAAQKGFYDLVTSLENGARNMMGIGVATAAAGIVVGTVSLTGVGQVMGALIETFSFGSVFLMLLLTAAICMVLGMGLPTTANYIVVSTLMAPVIVRLAAAHGLELPLVAVHLFVFYFGILADDTPPVGLAAFAASGISGADPIRTGLQSFYYDIRTAILPFMFVFNTDLLLIGVATPWHFVWVFLLSLAAMLLFAAATQGWLLTRNRAWESVALLLIAFSLFRPDFWRDQFFPSHALRPASALTEAAGAIPPGTPLRLRVEVERDDGTLQLRTVALPRPAGDDPLAALGFVTRPDGDFLQVEDIAFLSPAEAAGFEPGFTRRIVGFEQRLEQPAKAWFLFPPLLLFGWIIRCQRLRNA